MAEHLLTTAPAGEAWVIEQLRAAAREAFASGAPESATAYLRRALTESPPPEAGADLLLELGTAEINAGQPGWHDLEAAVHAAGDDTTRTAAALLFANGLRFHHGLAEAIRVCDGVAARLDSRDAEAHLTLEAMAVLCGLLQDSTAPSVAERARALLFEATERAVPHQALAVAAFVAAMANQPADQVADLARRAIAAGPRPLPVQFGAVSALNCAERYDEAQVLLDDAVIEAQAAANGTMLRALLALRAWLALRRGDLTAAEADARALRDAPGQSPPLLYALIASGVLVDELVERGDLDGAERALGPLAANLPGTSLTATMLRYARGRLLFAQRHFAEALGDFRAAGEIATGGLAISPSWLPWRSQAALAALAIGDPDTARRLSDEELQLARAFGAPRALGVALRAAGLVAGGPRGQRLLQEATEVLAGPDTRLEQARALADLGACCVAATSSVEARHLLRQAVDAAYRLGASRSRDRPKPSCAPPEPSRAGCCSAGSKHSPPASAASPNWPPKGSPTARSPKPSSSPPAPSRATSPTSSTSSTSRLAPPYRPPWQPPPKRSAPNHLRRGPAQKSGGSAGDSHNVRRIELPPLERSH